MEKNVDVVLKDPLFEEYDREVGANPVVRERPWNATVQLTKLVVVRCKKGDYDLKTHTIFLFD